MTVTGVQIRDRAVSHDRRYRYGTDNASRCTGAQGFIDCSGDVVLTCNQEGIYGVPTVSATQARWCRDNHLDGVDLDVALNTPGVLVFKGANHGYDGWGRDGHVGITVGYGGLVTQAIGHAYPASLTVAWNQAWTNAGYIPGVDYNTHTVVVPVPPKLPRIQHYVPPPYHPPHHFRLRGDDILDTQTKLVGWAYILRDPNLDPHLHDGIYGKKTAHAVRMFQARAGLIEDSIVGPATWQALFRI